MELNESFDRCMAGKRTCFIGFCISVLDISGIQLSVQVPSSSSNSLLELDSRFYEGLLKVYKGD